MEFTPRAGQKLKIAKFAHELAEHPALPGSGTAYGQEGRQATVYQLAAESGEKYALKVFKPRFRLPSLVGLAEKLAPFASLPGLTVCRRTMLIPQRHGDLLQQHPNLLYAALMPWIYGATWHDVIAERKALTPAQSLGIARSFLEALVSMEQQGIAHCDLSGPNVIVDGLEQEGSDENALTVALVDVEQLHAPGLNQPTELAAGSPGYAHRTAENGLWRPEADRFAAAVMLAEMLGWCDERIREASGEESYFNPTEMQEVAERAVLLKAVLQAQWGESVARLFERAWQSDTLADCPTMGEWLLALQRTENQAQETDPQILLIEAGRLEGEGNLVEALATYERALANADTGSALHTEIELIITDLQEKQQQEASTLALEQRAADLVQAEKWAEATAVYKTLLSQTTDPDQQKRWRTETVRCEAENELAGLFDDGLAAFERQDWSAARELLTAVVTRSPEYRRQGQSATDLLARIPDESGSLPLVQKDDSIERFLQLIWPRKFEDIADTRKLSRTGIWICLFVAVINAFGAIELGSIVLIDSGIFLLFAVGFFFFSRIAALVSFLYFVIGGIYAQYVFFQAGMTNTILISIRLVLVLLLLNATRATFALHKLNK